MTLKASKIKKLAMAVVFAVCLSVGQTDVEAASNRDVFGIDADYTSVLFDSTNGMPTSEANAIAQSSDGFIWLGGYSGLIRYDGTTFYRFDSSTGIASVFALYIDDQDRIWIGTNENGIAMMDRDETKVYGRIEGIKSNSVRAMVSDKEGNIIIGTTQGLAYVDSGTLEVHPIDDPQINQEYINNLTSDKEGNVYGLTNKGSLFIMSDLKVKAFYPADKISNEQVNSIYSDPDKSGILYLGTIGSDIITASVSDNDFTVITIRQTLPQSNINAMVKTGDNLWVTATNGLGFLDGAGTYHEIKDTPMNYSITNVMEGLEGNLWFTSTRQGVMKIVPDRFMDVSKLVGLDSRVVNSTCLNGKDLYLGTDSGLEILNTDSYSLIDNEITQMLDGVRIRCIKNDDINILRVSIQITEIRDKYMVTVMIIIGSIIMVGNIIAYVRFIRTSTDVMLSGKHGSLYGRM